MSGRDLREVLANPNTTISQWVDALFELSCEKLKAGQEVPEIPFNKGKVKVCIGLNSISDDGDEVYRRKINE